MTAQKPIVTARSTVGAGPSVPGRVWRVRRLDREGMYDLVVLGRDGAATAVVAVDATSGEPMSSATLPGQGDHIAIDADEARRRAGVDASAHAELVWAPSSVSRSVLYPFWEVRAPGTVVYVDQQGGVSHGLGRGRRGG